MGFESLKHNMSGSRDRWTDGTEGGWRGLQCNGRGSWRGNRGSWRGSRGNFIGGSGGSGRGFQFHLEPQNWTLGSTLDTIELNQLFLDEETPTINNVRYAASYNWLDSESPAMAVPGSPPFWAPLSSQDEPLKQDSGDFYRDTNAARFPAYPTEPAVRALLSVKSYVDFGAIDIMACASTLGNLLSFSRSIPSVFRLTAEMIGDTVFLVRKENSPTELLKGVKGYGHTFPAAYTKWDDGLEKSVCHQRVITYGFGGLQCLVRFGCDGYIKNPSLASCSVTGFGGTELPGAPGQELQVEAKGQEVDQAFIFEIKTRHISRKVDMEDVLPKLWITQTPGFLEAYYDKPGIFLDPQIRDVKQDVDGWEKENASALKTFHAVLARIRDVVGDQISGCVEVSWQGSGPLKISRAIPEGGELKRALPFDLAELWRGKLDG